MNRLLTAIALGFLTSQCSQAQEQTGVDLLRACEAATTAHPSSANEMAEGQYCIGLVHGAMYIALLSDQFHPNSPLFCPSEKSTTLEFEMVVVKFLHDHPKMLHEHEGIALSEALRDAYPCHAK